MPAETRAGRCAFVVGGAPERVPPSRRFARAKVIGTGCACSAGSREATTPAACVSWHGSWRAASRSQRDARCRRAQSRHRSATPWTVASAVHGQSRTRPTRRRRRADGRCSPRTPRRAPRRRRCGCPHQYARPRGPHRPRGPSPVRPRQPSPPRHASCRCRLRSRPARTSPPKAGSSRSGRRSRASHYDARRRERASPHVRPPTRRPPRRCRCPPTRGPRRSCRTASLPRGASCGHPRRAWSAAPSRSRTLSASPRFSAVCAGGRRRDALGMPRSRADAPPLLRLGGFPSFSTQQVWRARQL